MDGSEISNSESLGVCSEETGVDCVNHRCGSNHPAAKVPAVETLDCILTTRDLVEFEVDITLRIGIDRDVDNVAILGFGLPTHVVFELLDPIVSLFPVTLLAIYASERAADGELTRLRQTCCGGQHNGWP